MDLVVLIGFQVQFDPRKFALRVVWNTIRKHRLYVDDTFNAVKRTEHEGHSAYEALVYHTRTCPKYQPKEFIRELITSHFEWVRHLQSIQQQDTIGKVVDSFVQEGVDIVIERQGITVARGVFCRLQGAAPWWDT